MLRRVALGLTSNYGKKSKNLYQIWFHFFIAVIVIVVVFLLALPIVFNALQRNIHASKQNNQLMPPGAPVLPPARKYLHNPFNYYYD